MTAAPDGSVWFTEPLAVFDGEAWTRYEMPGPRSMKPEARPVRSLAFTPDGNVWMLA